MNKYQESLNFFMCANKMPTNITYEEIKNVDGEEVATYYMSLKELVDKATPKKVRYKTYMKKESPYCPVNDHRVYSGQKYCQYCGQRLDWSKE